MRRRLVLPLPLAAVLSACVVGPDYQRPSLPAASAAPFVSTTPGTLSGAAPQQNWWRLYDDPALDRLIVQAFAANTDLRVAAANLAAAEAVAAEARSVRTPSIALTAGASYGRNQPPLYLPGDRAIASGGIALSYELDLFGRVSRAVEAARADADALAFARDAVQVRIAASVAESYLTACTSAEAVATVRSSIEVAARGTALVDAQDRAGTASALDLERARSALAETRASLAPLEARRRTALFELTALLGLPPSGMPSAAADCAAAPEPQGLLAIGDGMTLLRRRPDIAQAERQLAAATARIGVATADLYPRIALGASATQTVGDGVGAAQGFNFGFGPLVSLAFANTAAARARIRQSEARTAAALAAFDGAVLTALKETEQALTALAARTRRHADLAEAEVRAERAFALAEWGHRAGSLGYLDVIVAQRAFLDLRLARLTAAQDLALGRVALFRALGGGWDALPPTS